MEVTEVTESDGGNGGSDVTLCFGFRRSVPQNSPGSVVFRNVWGKPGLAARKPRQILTSLYSSGAGNPTAVMAEPTKARNGSYSSVTKSCADFYTPSAIRGVRP